MLLCPYCWRGLALIAVLQLRQREVCVYVCQCRRTAAAKPDPGVAN